MKTIVKAKAKAAPRKKPGPAPGTKHSPRKKRLIARGKQLKAGDKPTGLLSAAELEALRTLAPAAPDFYTVEKPPHYNQDDDIECIDAMVAAFGLDAVRSHCRITAFKYLWRSEHKGQAAADIQKAIWYLRFSRGDDPREYRNEKGYVRA